MTLDTRLDTVLDRLVVPGYSRLGYALRSRSWPVDDPPSAALDGQVALVTGASSGLGAATAEGLARLGATVHLLGRSAERTDDTRAAIEARVSGAEVYAEQCDLSRLAEVRAFADAFAARQPQLGVLVHNAGVMAHQRTLTDEGNELNLATHVLGPFLLTGLLAGPLRAGAPSRVVFVASGGMYGQPLRSDDPQYGQGRYSGLAAYARTKRMQVVLAEQWAEVLRGDGVAVHSAHPGWADTPGVAAGLPWFRQVLRPLLRTPQQGADTVVWLSAADEPGATTGLFWHDRRPRPTHYRAATRETAQARRELWRTCRALTGLGETEQPSG